MQDYTTLAGKAQLPTPIEIKRLCEKHGKGNFNHRDRALIASVGFAHLDLADLSLIQVQDLITESGKLVVDYMLPARYSASGKERFFFIGKQTYFRKTLQAYIDWRTRNKFKLIDRDLFAGLQPESRFFLKDNGSEFDVTYRDREGKSALTEPYDMRRHFAKFYLGEGLNWQVLNNAFMLNYWVAKAPDKPAQAVKDLISMTGSDADTIRKKCARNENSIQDILENLYR